MSTADLKPNDKNLALAFLREFKAARQEGGMRFMTEARGILKLQEDGYWRATHETLEQFLHGLRPHCRRDRWFKLVKLGRFLRAYKKASGMEWEDSGNPILNERIWTRDLLKRGHENNIRAIEALAQRAKEIPYDQFVIEANSRDDKTEALEDRPRDHVRPVQTAVKHRLTPEYLINRPLSESQSRTLKAIEDLASKQEMIPPTIRELAQHLNVSPPAVMACIQILERKGYVKKHPILRRYCRTEKSAKS